MIHTPTDSIDVLIGRRLRFRRRQLGLSQNKLAVQMGIRFQQIQKYECAACHMSAARLWKAAEVLQVSVGYFFEGQIVDPAAPSEAAPSPLAMRRLLDLAEALQMNPKTLLERIER